MYIHSKISNRMRSLTSLRSLTLAVTWQLAHCMHQRTYSHFAFFFRQDRVQRVQSVSKFSKSLLSYSANDRGTHNLHSDLKKAQ